MFLVISKLFWFLFAPSHIIVWSIVATTVLLFIDKQRAARWCAAIGAALAIALGILPFGVWLMQPLENQYARPAWPARVDGILVLGGGLDAYILQSRGTIGENRTISRVISALEVSRRYPEARVIFSGGNLAGDQRPESIVARHILLASGLAPDRLVLESNARNTWENIVFAKDIAKPRSGEVWLLATSAYHLPRAMGIARRAGWKMVPWPTSYMTARTTYYAPREILDNLQLSDMAVREWIGYLAYRLSGKT